MSVGMMLMAAGVGVVVLSAGTVMACATTDWVFLTAAAVVVAGLTAAGLLAVWYSSGGGTMRVLLGGFYGSMGG